jgi:putative SOS response-associated peptidase YedK
MCGRFTLTPSRSALQAAFPGLDLPADYRPRYNIAPTQPVLALRSVDGAPRAGWLRWGLVPSWAKDPSIGNRMINARAETLAEKPSFRNAYRQRRCVVLADGFYEWTGERSARVPMRIRLTDSRPFGLAGLWERWVPEEGDPLETCTLITTTANTAVAGIHHRMPVILDAADRERWLDPGARDKELAPLLAPYGGDDLEVYAVSTLVNSPANELPACLDPAPDSG